MSIEDFALEHFSALSEKRINASAISCPRHAVFNSFLSDDSKQYDATTNSHSKRLIEVLK